MQHKRQSKPGPTPQATHGAQSIAWNYAGYACQIAFNLGLTWYIVRKISVVEYGLFLFVMSLATSMYLLDMGISSVLIQAFAETSAHVGQERVNRLLSTAFIALTALGILGVVIFCGLAAFLPGPFNIPHAYLREASIILIIAAFIILVGLSSIPIEQVYLASYRFDRTNQVQIGAATLQILLSLLVLAAGYGIVALAAVQLLVSFLRLVVFIAAMPAILPGTCLSLSKFEADLLKPLIQLSKWAFLNNLSSGLFDVAIWIVLGSLSSMEQAAIFGLAIKLPRQLWNLIDKGGAVAFPHLSAFSAHGDRQSLQAVFLRTQRLLSGGVLPFVVLGCFAAQPLIRVWVGSQYLGASVVLQILLLGVATHVTGYCSNQLLYATGDIKRAASIAVWEYGISLVLALVLVPRFGAVGLAAGMAAGQILINCGWLTWAACDVSGTSRQTLLRAIFGRLALPASFLCVAMALIWSASKFLSPPWKVFLVVVSGCIYLAVWGHRNLRTARRMESESVA